MSTLTLWPALIASGQLYPKLVHVLLSTDDVCACSFHHYAHQIMHALLLSFKDILQRPYTTMDQLIEMGYVPHADASQRHWTFLYGCTGNRTSVRIENYVFDSILRRYWISLVDESLHAVAHQIVSACISRFYSGQKEVCSKCRHVTAEWNTCLNVCNGCSLGGSYVWHKTAKCWISEDLDTLHSKRRNHYCLAWSIPNIKLLIQC